MNISSIKHLPSDKTSPYKDRFRVHHDRNQVAIKKHKIIEKRYAMKDLTEKHMKEIHEEKLVLKENNERWRHLNIIS